MKLPHRSNFCISPRAALRLPAVSPFACRKLFPARPCELSLDLQRVERKTLSRA